MSSFDVSSTPEEFRKALSIVSEVLGTVPREKDMSEDVLTEWTQKVLDLCYSIGGSYSEETVRAVAKALTSSRP